ncbi:DNA/RNA non-specific endonuclease [Modestobacter sp. I12A-02628]|uniref:DNA/RNA non-specific endonuclease n=1 Tax=Goekera deserti TaxID=2497753 RepID=A0A7K3WKK7_9ACTN|nr:DNA/RNA non-specific endonuclease [Goekera deserti]MPQ97040.1 DNA/RNA non-specific endonuclease [Goekera deserti]NDI46643.1 DNA/RNA non-specific endonuclease [Goekera deserti]NEL56399.1 DNA/RNA non-specific endonuclease [Goekera deserti]
MTGAQREDLSGRSGLDERFLGVPVPLPGPVESVPTVRLEYTHFSVLLRTDRRLAAVTGVAVDGALLQDLDRSGIDWRLDPRLPADQQTGEDVYARNDLDRGHLVRRADAVWGSTTAEAQQGNRDTFHYTNAAPQAASFNQGETLWLGLETLVLENAATYDRRLVMFTGPVLDDDDPRYRGVQVPLRFFKVVAFLDGGQQGSDPGPLAAAAYLLDQTPQVEDVPGVLAGAQAAGDPPPLGPFRTFGVPVADVASVTGLDLGPLVDADIRPAVGVQAGSAPGAPSGWVRLRTAADVVRSLGR